MKLFSKLHRDLNNTNKTNEKISILKGYFSETEDKNKLWTIALFTGKRPPRPINRTLVKEAAIEVTKTPEWLFKECYTIAGDLAETIALLLPNPSEKCNKELFEWIEELIGLKPKNKEEKKEYLKKAWNCLSKDERLVFNKLVLGGMRVGVSKNNLSTALSELYNIERPVIEHRLIGNWSPQTIKYNDLIKPSSDEEDASKPYPFYLTYPLENIEKDLSRPEEWSAEWKWDGIRAQFVKRNNELFIWSRGEELVSESFPEFKELTNIIPDGTVLDGEILAFKNNQPLPFGELQKRLGRKKVTQKVMEESPVKFIAYDLLETKSKDIRNKAFEERRKLLEKIISKVKTKSTLIDISELIEFNTWEQLEKLRASCRNYSKEGVFLKRTNSTYRTGRKRGDWWKWKIEPFSVDAVLLYAQRGTGKRANLYTDYTFAVWEEDPTRDPNATLIPFAKAYSGLDDAEIAKVNSFVLKHTKEKFGPVRSVDPELVFEIGFEGIQESTRHKSGVAVRFPRILRWRHDKPVEEADTLQNLKDLLKVYSE